MYRRRCIQGQGLSVNTMDERERDIYKNFSDISSLESLAENRNQIL